MSVQAQAAPKQAPPTAPKQAPRRKLSTGFDRFSGLYLWGLFIVVFGIWTPSEFLTSSTLHSVAAQQAVTGMIGLAILVPLAAGLYDLSAGATANVTGILTVVLIDNHHWAVGPAVVAGILVGVAIGGVNSFVVVKLGVNSFIATLGMGSILAAVEVIISSNSQPLPPTSAAWNNLTQTTVGGFQIVVLYLIILAVILWWVMAHTPAGQYLYAIGGNPEAARLSGVRIERHSTLALVMCSTIAGLAGVLFASLTVHRSTSGRPCCSRRSRQRSWARPSSARKVQRLGNAPGDLRAGHRRPGPPARVRGQLAQRHVQRRRADRGGGPVDQARAVRSWRPDQGDVARRRPQRGGRRDRRPAVSRLTFGSHTETVGPMSDSWIDHTNHTIRITTKGEAQCRTITTRWSEARPVRPSPVSGRGSRQLALLSRWPPAGSSNSKSSSAAPSASSTSTPVAASTTSSSVGSSTVATATAALTKWSAPVTSIGVTTPLKSTPPAGKTLVMLATSDPSNVLLQKSLAKLAALVHWNYSQVSYDPANPATFNAAVDTAITKHANYIAEAGIPLTPAVIAKAKAAGAMWVLTAVYPVSLTSPSSSTPTRSPTTRSWARSWPTTSSPTPPGRAMR